MVSLYIQSVTLYELISHVSVGSLLFKRVLLRCAATPTHLTNLNIEWLIDRSDG